MDLTKEEGRAVCNAYSKKASDGECWGRESGDAWAEKMEKECGSGDASDNNVDITGKDNAEIIFKFLISTNFKYLDNKPMNAVQAAGFLGNLSWESSGLDPAKIEDAAKDGFGLAQWSFERRTNLKNFAKSKGKEPSDLHVQLEFLNTELDGPESSILKDETFRTTSDVNVATERVMVLFEKPDPAWAHLDKRQKLADDYYKQFSNLAPGSTLSDGTCAGLSDGGGSMRNIRQ